MLTIHSINYEGMVGASVVHDLLPHIQNKFLYQPTFCGESHNSTSKSADPRHTNPFLLITHDHLSNFI
jgi:hypothetical protein